MSNGYYGGFASAPEGHPENEGSSAAHDSTNDYEQPPTRPQAQNRLSAYSFTNLPEVVPIDTYQVPEVATYHGKEVFINDHKEVRPATEKETAYFENAPEPLDEEGGKEYVPPATESGLDEKQVAGKERLNRRFCGIRAKWILLGLVVLILFIIALGAGLGASLNTSNGAAAGQVDAQSGALDGTKIALVTSTFSTDQGTEENLVMYFQHQTGEIRWMRLANNGSWIGGDTSTAIADDAKMNTPISAISYIWNGASFRRVYYIDNTNHLKEIWAGNTQPNQWTLGLLGDNISPLDDDQVGLLACWYGPTSGNEYIRGYAETAHSATLYIRLLYAKDANTFQEMSFNGETQVWSTEQTLPNLNGHATPACNNWFAGTVDYLMFVDLHDRVNVYWKDTSRNGTNNTSHPIGVWTNSSVSISNIEGSATLGYTKYLYAQNANDDRISGYDLTFAAENTTLVSNSDFVVQGKPGLPATGLGTIAQTDSAGGDDVLVFYQTNGTYISQYRRGIDSGQWSSTSIHVPST